MIQPGESRPPNNPALCRLIEGKRQWNYRPDAQARALGFRGWHERGYRPPFDAPNVTQRVTFNLDDAFPVTRRAEWEPFLREPDTSVRRRQLEAWLDRGSDLLIRGKSMNPPLKDATKNYATACSIVALIGFAKLPR